ncbi:MAG TPA: hypothetical protein VF476_12000 [Chitinophagaceae bacterium]
MNNFPLTIVIVFTLTTIASLWLFARALPKSGNRKYIMAGIFAWLALQSILSSNGFYDDNMSMPPRFAFAIAPALLVILVLFVTKNGRSFIDNLSLSSLTWLQTVRVPVEITLYFLMLEKTIPGLMTFEGRNFDILAGITAPVMAYFAYVKRTLNKKILLAWNIICLLLVLNIVVIAVLAVETPFQQLAFDQPNRAVMKFPIIWLPVFIVPVVIFGHLVSIRRLLYAPALKQVLS